MLLLLQWKVGRFHIACRVSLMTFVYFLLELPAKLNLYKLSVFLLLPLQNIEPISIVKMPPSFQDDRDALRQIDVEPIKGRNISCSISGNLI